MSESTGELIRELIHRVGIYQRCLQRTESISERNAALKDLSRSEDALRARIARLEAAGDSVTAMLKSLVDFDGAPRDSYELAYQMIKLWQEAYDRPQD